MKREEEYQKKNIFTYPVTEKQIITNTYIKIEQTSNQLTNNNNNNNTHRLYLCLWRLL